VAKTKSILRQLKTTFQAGELDPLMDMRSDVNAYANGAKQMQNVSLFSQGGFKRRNGTKLYASLSGNARLVGFDFDDNEQYILAFGNNRVDIYYLETDALVQSITGCAWTTSILFEMQFTQAGDTMIITHPSMVTQKLFRTGLTTFTKSNYAFDTDTANVYQPYYKFANQATTISASGTTGSVTLTSSADHFNSNYVNVYLMIEDTTLLITNYTSATQVTATILGTLRKRLITDPFTTEKGTKVITVNDPLHGLANSASITISGANSIEGIDGTEINGSKTITVLDEDTYTITASGSTNANNTAAGGGTAVFITSANQANTKWQEQTFSAVRGYPASATFHDGRLWFGGSSSLPDWVWASKVDEYFNFDLGEANDSDSIQSSIGASQVADIRHLLSNRHLLIFTANGEFFCPQGDQSPLTPTNFTARRQTTHGSSFVNVKTLEGGAMFVQKHGRAVRELLFTDLELSYSATNISVLASHLIQTPIDMTVLQGTSERPESYAIFINSDGTAGVFHAVRSEKLAGWTEWKTTTGATFKSIEAVGSRLFFTVFRNSAYYIEEMGLESNTLDHASTFTIGSAGTVFTGLSNYASKTVKVRSGNFYMGEFAVTSGGQLTLSSGFDTTTITVGFDYELNVETMPVETVIPSGSLQGKPKRISKVVLGLNSALATSVSGNKLILRQVTDDLSIAPTPVSGKKDFYILGYNKDATVTITQDDPLPVKITGLIMEYMI
tara:strand:+ start:150 stop:2336 length:2187 start_codon:yes stop_codon:yes gene_type:complete